MVVWRSESSIRSPLFPCFLCPVFRKWMECQCSFWPRTSVLSFNRQGVCLTAFWRQVQIPRKWVRTGTEQGRGGWELRIEEEAGKVWTSNDSIRAGGHLEHSLCKCSKHAGYSSITVLLIMKQRLHPSIYLFTHSLLPFSTDPSTHSTNLYWQANF